MGLRVLTERHVYYGYVYFKKLFIHLPCACSSVAFEGEHFVHKMYLRFLGSPTFYFMLCSSVLLFWPIFIVVLLVMSQKRVHVLALAMLSLSNR